MWKTLRSSLWNHTWNPPKNPKKFSKEPTRNSPKEPPLRNYEEPLVCKGGPRYPDLIKRDEQTNILKYALVGTTRAKNSNQLVI